MTELLLMVLLAPVMQSDLRAAAAPAVYMLDASPFGGGICKAEMPSQATAELWRHTEQRGYYTKLQQGASMALQELGFEPEPSCGHEQSVEQSIFPSSKVGPSTSLRDSTILYDCIELFSGYGNWSRCHAEAGLRVHLELNAQLQGKHMATCLTNRPFLL